LHAEIIFTKGMARQNHGSRLARDAGVPGRTCKGRHSFAGAFHQISLIKWVKVMEPTGSEVTGIVPYTS
jgi:hypothetical protein